MNDTVIVAHPNTDSTRNISAQVATVSDQLVILETSSDEDLELLCREYGCALLIIDAGLFQKNTWSSCLPHDSAILTLLEADQIDNCLANTTILTGNCSLLISSAADSLLKHHVQLLLKQRTATKELLFCRNTINTLSKELASSKHSFQALQRYLDILSERDGLTGLYNRKHFTAILRQEFQRGKRYETDLSILLLDIDNFKEINQKHGHLFGDFILNEIAARLTFNTRVSDLCFRFGGGNFIILLPQSPISHGRKAAEKLNKCCSEKIFDNGQDTEEVTISIGIASLCDSLPDSPDQFVNMADRAMYQAKARGKNRCRIYQAEHKKINVKDSKTNIIRQINSLPPLPATVSRVLEVTANPESCGDDLVNAILPDQAMCTAILKIANSAFFGIPREVATMDKAVNVLGFNEVHNIVLGRAVFTSLKNIGAANKRTINEFWQHSFHCGLAAKIIADTLQCPPSELFIAGLIHDIGKLAILITQPNDYLSILETESSTGWHHRLEIEQQQFGVNHGEIGLQLLTRWMFPEQLLTTVGYHHSPEKCNQHILYAIIVQLSDVLSILANDAEQDDFLFAQVTTQLPEITALWEQLNLTIDEEQLQQWMTALRDSIEKDSAILHIFAS